jgi:hypothetical protein
MSHDDGPRGEFDLSFDRMRAQLVTRATNEPNWFENLCRAVGIDPYAARRAMDPDAEISSENIEIISKLTAGQNDPGRAGPFSIWERVQGLAWEYVYKAGLTWREGKAFVKYLQRLFGSVQPMGNQRFRKTPPSTILEIAEFYEGYCLDLAGGE